jgi:ABC-type sugar transport system ATPase subunit
MSEPAFLEMTGISKRFPGVLALNQVSFDVMPGEVHALVGENGAGKSTLMNILGGVYPADEGQIHLQGRRLELRSPMDAIRAGISVVYQELMLAQHLSAAENVMLHQEPRRWGFLIDKKAMRSAAQETVDQLGVAIDVRQTVGSLSIASRQIIEIARALHRNLSILVLDEPSAVLGKSDMDVLFAVIRRLKSQRIPVVYISHRLDEVFEIADRVTILKDGAVVGTRPTSELDEDQLVGMMIGRSLDASRATRRQPGEVVLRVEGLRKSGVLHDISFDVHEHEIVGLAGLVGSKRTDLARMIFGAEQPDDGRIYLGGKPVRFRSPREGVAHGLALLPEDRKTMGLLLNRPVRENISISNLAELLFLMILRLRKEDRFVRELIKGLNIHTTGPGQIVRNLSGGNQQKVVLARWLGRTSRLFIFDEPTRGVDVGGKREIHKLIEGLAERGAAILMISSELPEILGLSDRILVMRNGAIVGRFVRAEATEEVVMQAVIKGESNDVNAGNAHG